MSLLSVSPSVLQTVNVALSFENYSQPINALCFTDDSRYLVTSADDKTLQAYDVQAGKLAVKREDQEWGVGKVCATHNNHTVLYTSTKSPDLFYYNWSRDSLIWHSTDHSHRIVSLSMSPSSDSFLSLSTDYRMLYFDLRQRRPVYGSWLKEAGGMAAGAFDPTGVVFGLAYPQGDNAVVKLFDSRAAEQGPFATKLIPGEVSVTTLEFSDDGGLAMVCTADNQISVLDAISLDLKHTIKLEAPPAAVSVAVFSACSKYILSGVSHQGILTLYEAESGKELHKLCGRGAVRAVAWCKKYCLLAAGSMCLNLWIPEATLPV